MTVPGSGQPAPSPQPFRLTPYQDGDEGGILALFESVFKARRSVEHWNWQFKHNPYGSPRAILARDAASDRCIGQYTVLPLALNLMGRPGKTAQSLDTMVHPDHRMHGIFEASARECYQRLRQDGCALVYGFPNRNSFPGFVRKLGWTRVLFPTSYFRILSIRDTLRRRLRVPVLPWIGNAVFQAWVNARLRLRRSVSGRNGAGLTARMSDRVPAGYDELWNAVKAFEILSLWKDEQYFKWRYDDSPVNRFTYYYLARDGRIDALCVFVMAHGACHVLELIVRDRSVDMARYLVDSVALHAMRAGARRLIFTGATLDFFDEVFCGWDHEINFDHVFCLIPLDDGLLASAIDAKNWTITEGDCDTF